MLKCDFMPKMPGSLVCAVPGIWQQSPGQNGPEKGNVETPEEIHWFITREILQPDTWILHGGFLKNPPTVHFTHINQPVFFPNSLVSRSYDESQLLVGSSLPKTNSKRPWKWAVCPKRKVPGSGKRSHSDCWNLPIFNRKYIFKQRVHFPATAMLVDPGG